MRIYALILVFIAFTLGCKKKDNQISPQNQCLTPTEVKIQHVSGQEVSFELIGTDSISIGKVSWTIISDEKTLQIETNGKTHVAEHFSKSGEFRVTAVIETVCKTKNTLTRSENIQIEQYTRQWISDIGPYLDTTFWVLAESLNGGCVAVGSAGYPHNIVSLGPEGNILWKRELNGNNYEKIRSIVSADDGGYILGGDWIGTDHRYGIMKISSSGETIWEKTYSGLGNPYSGQAYDRLTKVINASDGGYLLAGYSSSLKGGDKSESPKNADAPRNYSLTDFWIIKVDAKGNKVWDKTIGGDAPEHLGNIIKTSDGGYLIIGSSSSKISGDKTEDTEGQSDIWLVKISKNGMIEWNRTSPPFSGCGANIIGMSDGSSILVGQSGTGNISYAKLNSQGKQVWEKYVKGSYAKLIPTDDGFMMFGRLDQYNFIKFSKEGEVQQSKKIDLGAANSSWWSAATTESSSGGFYGLIYSEGNPNIFYVK